MSQWPFLVFCLLIPSGSLKLGHLDVCCLHLLTASALNFPKLPHFQGAKEIISSSVHKEIGDYQVRTDDYER
jgi:hypothetical protein